MNIYFNKRSYKYNVTGIRKYENMFQRYSAGNKGMIKVIQDK